MRINQAAQLQLLSSNYKVNNRLQKIFERLSTGKRINRASDDAAMLSIAKQLEKQVRGFRVVENNISDGMSAIAIGDGAAGSMSEMVQRQRELAIQASNGTLNQDQRDALNTEFQQITAEIDRTARASNFNGMSLLDGQSPMSDGTGNIQVDPNSDVSSQVAMPPADLTASALGLDTLDISNPANAAAAISGLDAAASQINSVRTSQGATYNRLESSYNNSVTNRINTTSALSLAEDMDFAAGVSERARDSILQQSNISVMRNFNDIAKNNLLSLLR